MNRFKFFNLLVDNDMIFLKKCWATHGSLKLVENVDWTFCATLSREQHLIQMGRCQNVTFANYRLKECQAGVGKRPRKTRASYCIDLTPLQPTPSLHSHCTASFLTQCCATKCAFLRQHLDAARRHLRLRRLFSTPASECECPRRL